MEEICLGVSTVRMGAVEKVGKVNFKISVITTNNALAQLFRYLKTSYV